jgi:hypothetical protein
MERIAPMIKNLLPKKGSFFVSSINIGTYKLVETGHLLVASSYFYKTVCTNDKGEGLFHDMVGDGIGFGPISNHESDDFLHYITCEDIDGDQIFECRKGRYTGPASGEGTFTLLGGTGKYKGIEGSGKHRFEGLNYNYHDPENPGHAGPVQARATSKGSYTLP